jgi:hypothetical protein
MKRLPMETEEELKIRIETYLGKLRIITATIVVCHMHLEKQMEALESEYPDLAEGLEEAWGDVINGLNKIGDKITQYVDEVQKDRAA